MPMCAESYSMIAMPNADSHNARVLQEDNTELAYECKLPRLKPPHTNHASPCTLASKQSRASFRGTLPKVRAAIEPHRPYQRTHAPSPCAQTSTPRASTRRAVALFCCAPPAPADACLLAHRSPPAASALSRPVRLGPTIVPVAPKLTFALPWLRRSPSGFRY